MSKRRESAIIYEQFYKGVQKLPPEQKAEAYDAYCELAIYGKPYEGDNLAIAVLLEALCGKINAANESYQKKVEIMNKNRKPKKSDDITRNQQISTDISKKSTDIFTDTDTDSVTDSVTVTDSDTDTENDGEKRGEKSATDVADPHRPSNDYQTIVDAYNRTCVSFPSVKFLSDSRKKAIHARLNTYSIGDFQTMFEKAEKSDFLKGANDRNWSATFDWMIKDSNFAKILDGNYDNGSARSSPRGHPKSRKEELEEMYRMTEEWANS